MLQKPSCHVLVGLALAALLPACQQSPLDQYQGEIDSTEQALLGVATSVMFDAVGNETARVRFTQSTIGTRVQVTATNLPTGIHAFHVHANNDPANGDGCVAPAFTSADGHYNPGALSHPNHAGDMPVVFFSPPQPSFPGSPTFAHANFITTNFTTEEIKGRALILHALADNCANIPTRYETGGVPGPDATTLATGDAGGRLACGLIGD